MLREIERYYKIGEIEFPTKGLFSVEIHNTGDGNMIPAFYLINREKSESIFLFMPCAGQIEFLWYEKPLTEDETEYLKQWFDQSNYKQPQMSNVEYFMEIFNLVD